MSLQNLAPAVPLRLLVTLTTSLGIVGALTIDLVSYQTFLLLLGSFFVPLFAVMLADWLLAGGRYEPETHVFAARDWRTGPIVAWLAGFALYQWLYPTGGPSWWVDVVDRARPTGLGDRRDRAELRGVVSLGRIAAAIEHRPATRAQRA